MIVQFEPKHHAEDRAIDMPQSEAKLKSRITNAIERRITADPQAQVAPPAENTPWFLEAAWRW
ncbi:MAG TPA: hypothetical protein VEI57_05655 [Nitrospirota bacterium]|nr:hypothetical protein [Nitrospirota bacterium]